MKTILVDNAEWQTPNDYFRSLTSTYFRFKYGSSISVVEIKRFYGNEVVSTASAK